MKRLNVCIIAVLVLIFTATPVMAHPRQDFGIESYIFNLIDSDEYFPFPAPAPYRYVRSLYARDIGVDSFMHINEIFYSNGRFFITNGASIVVLDDDFNLVAEITGIHYGGSFQDFVTLDGIFVASNGDIYVAEPMAGRIVHLDAEFNLIRTLGRPEGIPMSETLSYQPTKVVVDDNGRIYVISNNVFEGIIELNPDGSFNRYFGVINVRYTVMDLFWRQIRTPAQRMRMALWLPTNFTNLALDPYGFVFATVSDADTDEAVRKLNARGENILRRPTDNHHVGDMEFNTFGLGIPTGPSVITHIHVTDFGVYYILDRTRNRVFAYDEDGHTLFAFGGQGTREGLTRIVTGMAVSENLLVKADRGSQSLEVFALTSYGEDLLAAVRHQYNADWNTAAWYWSRVLDINPHFQYAHLGLGRWFYRNGYFEQAAWHFQRAQNVVYFNMAYTRTRGEFFERNFNIIVIGLAVAISGLIAINIVKKVKTRKGVAA